MSRSLKKPPFVHYKFMKRVEEAKESTKRLLSRLGQGLLPLPQIL